MDTIVAKVERVRFRNDANGYTVLVVRVEENDASTLFMPGVNPEDGTFTAVGCMAAVRIDDWYAFTGEWVEHPRFGRQFQIHSATLQLPNGRDGAIRYLADTITGVGPARAARIVDVLGPDCIQRIQDDPACLDQVDFLTRGQREELLTALERNQTHAKLSALICGDGITPNMAAKIVAALGPGAVEIVRENPYILADTVDGIGFLTADRVAQRIGVKPDSQYRIEAAIRHALRSAGDEGHVYLKPADLIRAVQELCTGANIGVPEIKVAMDRLKASEAVIKEPMAIYDCNLYRAEVELADAIEQILDSGRSLSDDVDYGAEIAAEEARNAIEYAPEQAKAIRTALSNPLSIITGGPGTGKSTVVNSVLEIYRRYQPNNPVYLCAPTGRAAQRLKETTGEEAATIHRLLHYAPGFGFEFNYHNPLDGPGLLIADEFSMCDIELARDLLGAAQDLQVVIVGDVDQLPSVGPGSVLRDMINSGRIPTVRLRFNYRQANGSRIAEYANMIAAGEMPPWESGGDLECIQVSGKDEAASTIDQLVRGLVKDGLGPMDIQILAPMKKGVAGVDTLNDLTRQILNPAISGQRDVRGFRINDKVIVVKNNYMLGVFNGDIGQVSWADRGMVEVDFGDRAVLFEDDKVDLLQLAYAITIHKSQGSEFPVVIMPLVHSHYIMLQRNLIYTGMTRARKHLILVAEQRSLKRAVSNDLVAERYSRLCNRLQEGVNRHDKGSKDVEGPDHHDQEIQEAYVGVL